MLLRFSSIHYHLEKCLLCSMSTGNDTFSRKTNSYPPDEAVPVHGWILGLPPWRCAGSGEETRTRSKKGGRANQQDLTPCIPALLVLPLKVNSCLKLTWALRTPRAWILHRQKRLLHEHAHPAPETLCIEREETCVAKGNGPAIDDIVTCETEEHKFLSLVQSFNHTKQWRKCKNKNKYEWCD